jgi:hypothetical protein
MVNNAVEIKLHAKQRAGQMLVEGKKTGDLKTRGGKQSVGPSTLPQVGITRHESSDWQKITAVPEQQLEKAIAIVKELDVIFQP